MTKREGAVLSAFMGKLLTDFSNFHGYVEDLLGRPVFAHEFASETFAAEIKYKAREEFNSIIEGQTGTVEIWVKE